VQDDCDLPDGRRPATKVVVFQWPCGMEARSRSPRGARPRVRAILVDAHVSSMKTSLSGSRSIWPSNRSSLQDVRPLLLGGVRGLFLSVIFRRWKKRDNAETR